MKLRYSIFAALAALLAVFTTSCEEENAITLLDEIQVSSSYVALPAAGGSYKVTVTATDAWAISEIPEWLTVNPSSGEAGEKEVTFTATAATDSREAEVKVVCAGKTQLINVIVGTVVFFIAISVIFQNLNKIKARAQKNLEVAADKNEAAKEEKK